MKSNFRKIKVKMHLGDYRKVKKSLKKLSSKLFRSRWKRGDYD